MQSLYQMLVAANHHPSTIKVERKKKPYSPQHGFRRCKNCGAKCKMEDMQKLGKAADYVFCAKCAEELLTKRARVAEKKAK